jgi:hypothetical protein
MDRLNSVSKYFNEKERKRLTKVIDDSDSGFPTMSFDETRHFNQYCNFHCDSTAIALR